MAKGKPIALNELPKEKEYEEYVSAFFQCGHYYVERNIVDRGTEELLELDLIITNYSTQMPDSRLIEIKSGGWGFSDVFKIRGWMDYINFDNATIISQVLKKNVDFFHRKSVCVKH